VLIGNPSTPADSGIWVITSVDTTDPEHPMATLTRRSDSVIGKSFRAGEKVYDLQKLTYYYLTSVWNTTLSDIVRDGVIDDTEIQLYWEPSPNLGYAQTGAETADFTATNAPAVISPQKWLQINVNGVAGWIPWFST
jgi:hypothetical protein